jgi:RHS repeat-associated protein
MTSAREFTGKERDAESGLDFFGARYTSSAQGRFTSVDPISGTVLHLLNPQRWNMYAYAVNNPLAYTDPDGRDAIAVKFGNLAHDLGHAGVVSVHHDGKGTFADFGPQHRGEAHDAGKYNFVNYKTQINYGPDGKPTKDSLSALANELADDEGQPHDSVSVAYFKTSDAETAALDAYINAAKNQQAEDADVLGRFSRLHLVLHEWNAKSWCRPRVVNTHDTESSIPELLVRGGSNGNGNQSAEGKGYVKNLLQRRERKAGVPVKTIENRKCE